LSKANAAYEPVILKDKEPWHVVGVVEGEVWRPIDRSG